MFNRQEKSSALLQMQNFGSILFKKLYQTFEPMA